MGYCKLDFDILTYIYIFLEFQQIQFIVYKLRQVKVYELRQAQVYCLLVETVINRSIAY